MKRPAMAAWGLLLPTAWWREHIVGHCRNSLIMKQRLTKRCLRLMNPYMIGVSLIQYGNALEKYFETKFL